MARRRAFALLTVTACIAALAQTGQAAPSTWEQQLTFDSRYAEGEPSIAVNPTNPKNIILTFLANIGYGFYGVESGHVPTDPRIREQTMQGCDVLVTFDAGKHWKRTELPVTSFTIDPTHPNCSDTLVTFDRRGIAYVVGSAFQFPTFAVGQGDFRMITSSDGGRTWSKSSVISPTLLSPGANPGQWQGARFYDDREFMALDPTNGTIYINGTQGRATVNAQGNTEYLAASHDGGRTWADAVYVGDASAVQLAAAYGVVVFTSPPPQGAQRECTSCTDVVVSTDGGKTINRYPTLIPGSSAPLSSNGGTVADPRTRGRFVIATVVGNDLWVYRSSDGGKRWNKTAVIDVPGRGASKVWLDWSRWGVLGIGWRATTSDGHYRFYGAVSYDNGKSFTVKMIGRGDSAANEGVWVAGDDTSTIYLTHDHFYASWGDWRGGSLHTWWGGFDLRR